MTLHTPSPIMAIKGGGLLDGALHDLVLEIRMEQLIPDIRYFNFRAWIIVTIQYLSTTQVKISSSKEDKPHRFVVLVYIVGILGKICSKHKK